MLPQFSTIPIIILLWSRAVEFLQGVSVLKLMLELERWKAVGSSVEILTYQMQVGIALCSLHATPHLVISCGSFLFAQLAADLIRL